MIVTFQHLQHLPPNVWGILSCLTKKKEKKNWKLNPVNDICQKNYENSHIWTLLLFSFTWMKFYDGKETTWFNLTLEFILIILTYIYTRTYDFLFLIQLLFCKAEKWLACMFEKEKITHKQDAANNSNSTYPKWHFNHRLACKGDIRNIASLSWVPEQDIHHREAFI